MTNNELKYWGVNNPKVAVFLSLLMFVIISIGIYKMEFTSDYRYFFSEKNPELLTFDEHQLRFGKGDNIMVVMAFKEEIYTPRNLHLIEKFTEEAWQTPLSSRVDSVSNFQHVFVEDDDIFVDSLIIDAINLNTEDIAKKKSIAENEPVISGFLVSEDATHTAINITVISPDTKPEKANAEAVAFVNTLIKKFEAQYPDVKFYTSGQLVIDQGFMDAAMLDASTLIPAMYITLVVFLWLFLSSFLAMLGTMFVVLFSSAAGIGMGCWLGLPMSTVAISAPLIILTLAVADSVHLLASLIYELQHGQNKRNALIQAIDLNLKPIFLTSLTTVIGFLSLNFNESPPVRDMGNIVAIGVILAFIYSLVFLPAFIMLCPLKVKPKESGEHKIFCWFARKISAHHTFIGISVLVTSITLGWVASKNELNDMLFDFFGEQMQMRQDINYIKDNMTGIMGLNYTIYSKENDGVTDPEYVNNLDKFTHWLSEQPGVLHVSSYSDIIKRLNKMLNGNDQSFYKTPENREAVSQNLFVYEMSLPFGMDLNNQIDFSREATKLSLRVDNLKTQEMVDLKEKADQWLTENTPDWFRAEATGPDYMFAKITFRTISSMTWGTLLALVLISLTLIVSLRSWKLGLISFIPNVIPLVFAFGVWGFFVGEIGLIASSVSVIGLGLIIDDNVHFLTKYQRAVNVLGHSEEDAIEYAFQRVGPALTITTVILVMGFAILGFSNFKPNSQMGILTSLTIAAALTITFLLLPAMLLWFKPFLSEKHATENSNSFKINPVENSEA